MAWFCCVQFSFQYQSETKSLVGKNVPTVASVINTVRPSQSCLSTVVYNTLAMTQSIARAVMLKLHWFDLLCRCCTTDCTTNRTSAQQIEPVEFQHQAARAETCRASQCNVENGPIYELFFTAATRRARVHGRSIVDHAVRSRFHIVDKSPAAPTRRNLLSSYLLDESVRARAGDRAGRRLRDGRVRRP